MSRGAAPRTSIALRLLVGTLAAGLMFSVLSTVARGWFAYMEGRRSFIAEIGQIQEILQPALTKAIWEMDRGSVDVNLDGSLRLAAIGRVAVTIRLADTAPEVHVRERTGWRADPSLPLVRQTLTYSPYDGASEVVGELEIAANGAELDARLHRELAAIFVTQLLQSLLLAGVVMWLFNRSVTRHVRAVAVHLARLAPDNLTRKLRFQGKTPREDELDQLAAGLNGLQDRLAVHLEQQTRYEREISRHRDHLAELVSERTRELEIANRKLDDLSRHDGLTDLPNRRHFDLCKEAEFRRARRLGMPLTLLLCDIDYFKRYNDTYGHAAGDTCLRTVGPAIEACFRRAGEVAARVGGEEFAALLPGVGGTDALARAEHLRREVEALAIPHAASDVGHVVTLSIGIAELDDDTPGFDALYQRADRALYCAKDSGRNRVVFMHGGQSRCESGR